jgi:hypothetical protein
MIADADEPAAADQQYENQRSEAPKQTESTHGILLSDRSIIFVFFFVGRFLFTIGLRDDFLILVTGSDRNLRFRSELFVGRLFHYDRHRRPRATARGRNGRRLIGIALVRAALRARRNRLAEVIELRVTAITGVLLSEVRHKSRISKRKSGDTLAPPLMCSK